MVDTVEDSGWHVSFSATPTFLTLAWESLDSASGDKQGSSEGFRKPRFLLELGNPTIHEEGDASR